MEANQSARHAARRFLEDRVRVDWDYPHTPDYWSASDEEVRGVGQFRERYYGDSSPESSNEDVEDGPYRFDSPDSIGDAVQSRAQRRKRKRIMALAEEMKENEGLRLWVHRRDVWTGAASVSKYGTKRRAKRDSSSPLRSTLDGSISPIHGNNELVPGLPLLVPVAAPLLPDNAIRKSITPRTYSDIYQKTVMSSRAPAVPINLADMTRSLVWGWKKNGEWPPKAAPLDPLAGGRKQASMMVGARVSSGVEPFLSHHPHLQKGVDSMKKMLHLSAHQHGTAMEG